MDNLCKRGKKIISINMKAFPALKDHYLNKYSKKHNVNKKSV